MGKASRVAFGESLARLGEVNKNIVALDADLSKSTRTDIFAKKFPDRFFDMGIAEANMIGTGAGLALCGKIPFICSFACFLTGRYDIIRISIAYARANVKIVGTHAGIGIGEDGYSQQGLEDIALMRVLPGVAVIQPADEIETAKAMDYAVEHDGPMYLRFTRQNLEIVSPQDYKFQFGKGVKLKDGSDATIIASGGTVHNAVLASEELSKKGIKAGVINIHTIKPIDVGLLAEEAGKSKKVVTVEDHTVIGGLGGAVSEALSRTNPVKMKMLGVQDVFGESGLPKELYEKHGLSTGAIVKATEELCR